MSSALWIIQVLLAILFLFGGSAKLTIRSMSWWPRLGCRAPDPIRQRG